ncbi:MAG TPA: vWA domain-containing protein [Oligoflexia bacterium]|nr:vWA domain-containing protein [Oligoflexia bacterium]
MKQLFFSRFSAGNKEKGATIILFAAVIMCLLTMAGLALDSGNLYSTHLALQAAADAGALAGAGIKAGSKHSTNPVFTAAVAAKSVNVVEDVVKANLQIRGISNYTFTEPTTWNAGDNTMTVAVSSNVNLYLMGAVPGIGANFRMVTAKATANVDPANVALILDTSGSMACPNEPATGSPCDCEPNCPQNASSKIGALKAAVTDFLDFFDPTRDSLSLIAVGTGAEVLVPFKYKGGGFDRGKFDLQLAGLTAQGGTNPSDGFLRAYLNAKDNLIKGKLAYVYFSDGAPTAGRFWFRSAITQHKVRSESFARYDYLNWGITDKNAAGDTVALANTFYGTPTEDSSQQYYWRPRLLARTDPAVPPARAIWPSANVENPKAHLQTDLAAWGFTVYLPDGQTRKLGDPDLWNGNVFDWSKWGGLDHLRMYADASLVLSDFVRQHDGIVYTIGYGLAAPRSMDPYQNPGNPTYRKDYLLTRASADPCGLMEFNPNFPGHPTLVEILKNAADSGGYYPTADLEKLESIFERIATKIKLRLTR